MASLSSEDVHPEATRVSSAHTASAFRVLVLGPFSLARDGVPIDASKWQRRVASLLKLLATAPEHRRLRDEVIDTLWPDAAPEAGAGNLRIVAHRLRLALGGGEPPSVLAERGWIALNPAYSWEVDLHRFEEMARLAGDDVAALEEVLALYRGEPLLEERYEDWAIPIRERVQRTWRELCLHLAAVYQTRSSYDQAVRSFERVLESDPIDEEALRGLLTALYSAGRRADALRRYQQFEQRLADELGVPPSAETMAVVQQLHAQYAEESTVDAINGPGRDRSLPIGGFLGALPDGPMLGREEELERILFAADSVEAGTGRLVLLSGEQGVGKTRLAQEVTLRLRDRGFVVATGRCYERERMVPLYPFLESITLAYDSAPRSVQLEVMKRWRALGQLLPELAAGTLWVSAGRPAEHTRLEGAWVNPPLDQEQQHHLSRVVAGFLGAIAEEKPLALMLDDLHWADQASLDLLQHLARHTRGQRILLLGTYSDSAVNREHPLGQAMRDLAREGLVERVALHRLSLEGTAALVNATVGEMEASQEFIEFVQRRTRGNPFFIEKMLQALGGHYCLVRQIGSGGMGRVFEAVDTRTGEAVAAKIMFARTEADPKALLRFEQEGAVLAQLTHPNIVRVYGTFLEEHANCIIMELLEGRSLRELLRSEHLTLDRIKQLMEQVAAALVCAHEHGIVHRDIKPDNIMVVEDDRVKVTDFGIARLVRPKGRLTTLTSTGMTMGTPLYMAPEQIEGKQVDGRADLYSLGAVLYQMVTGRPPFEGHDPLSIAFKHVHEAPAPPHTINAGVPADWEMLILRALAKDPAERFQTATAMEQAIAALPVQLEALQAAATAIPSGSEPHERERPPRTADLAPAAEAVRPSSEHRASGKRRRIWLAWGGAAAAALLAATGGLVLARSHGTKPATPSALRGVPAKLKPSSRVARSPKGTGPGQFRGPSGIAIGTRGEVYAADSLNNRVQVFSSKNGTWLRQIPAALREPATARLNGPTNVAVGPDGSLFVTDYGNHRIVVFSSDGRYLRQIQRPKKRTHSLRAFNSLALDRQGNLYATDLDNNEVLKLSPRGTWLGQWGRSGSNPGQFYGPEGIEIGPDGKIYVVDKDNNRVQTFSVSEGTHLRATYLSKIGRGFGSDPGEFDKPEGIDVDRRGNVYIADTQNDRIEVFSHDGHFLRLVGRPGTGRGQMRRPSSVATDSQGNIYVADYSNDRIERFSSKGRFLWTTPHS